MEWFTKKYWQTFLAKKVVTRSIWFSLMQIASVTILFFIAGYMILSCNEDLSDTNLLKLKFNTAKFGTWFLLGYAGMQSFGYEIEKDRLIEFEENTYRAHAQTDFHTYTNIEKRKNDDEALIKLNSIDSQRIRIKGDGFTSFLLFIFGVISFFVISVLELFFY